MVAGRQIVDPPSFTPTPYGLLTTVEFPPTNDLHWQAGITYQPTCGISVTGMGSTSYDACIAVTGVGVSGLAPPTFPGFANTHTTAARGATSFETYVEFDCAPVGNTPAQAQAIAERALQMAEPWQVERAFWTGLTAGPPSGAGTLTVFPHLAANTTLIENGTGILMQDAAVNVTGTSAWVSGDLNNIERALGGLEAALANCYDGIGVIHVPQLAIPTMDAWGVIRTVGQKMYTLNGNEVAVGAGYPGTGPDGSTRPGNQVWLYATGNVFGFKSDVHIRAKDAAAIDRSVNTVKYIASRTWVLAWDCCHFASLATLGVPGGT